MHYNNSGSFNMLVLPTVYYVNKNTLSVMKGTEQIKTEQFSF